MDNKNTGENVDSSDGSKFTTNNGNIDREVATTDVDRKMAIADDTSKSSGVATLSKDSDANIATAKSRNQSNEHAKSDPYEIETDTKVGTEQDVEADNQQVPAASDYSVKAAESDPSPEDPSTTKNSDNDDVVALKKSDQPGSLMPPQEKVETMENTAETQKKDLTEDDYHKLVSEYPRPERRKLIEKLGKDSWKSMTFGERYSALLEEYGMKST